ncbi:hypothetical protein DFJ74DRAFT_683429 [Hyaloraphidium curvatum]|nr:hypothetical protein DFJ74DRAFT_683429 [Hyaloraphidium curvatum]
MPRGSVCYRRQCCARVRNISESCVPRGGRSGGKTDHCCPSNAPAPPALHPSQPATDSATTRARDRHLSSKWSSIRGSPGRRRRPRHRRWRRPPQPPSRVILARRDNAVVLRDALDGGEHPKTPMAKASAENLTDPSRETRRRGGVLAERLPLPTTPASLHLGCPSERVSVSRGKWSRLGPLIVAGGILGGQASRSSRQRLRAIRRPAMVEAPNCDGSAALDRPGTEGARGSGLWRPHRGRRRGASRR